jgi:cytoskeletal protein RodZ
MNNEVLAQIGAELHDERVKAKLSLDVVSRKLKIRKFYIKAIENGDTNLLKFDAYTIGYIKHYAEFLSLNPKTYLERIKSGQSSLLPPISSNNLITGKEFLPSKAVLVTCSILLILIYFFIEFTS